MDNKNKRRQLIGTVYSDKMDKTIVVKVQKKAPHPIYRKYINKSKKYYAQDTKNLCSKGDIVVMSARDLFDRRKRRNRYALNVGANLSPITVIDLSPS